MATETIRPSFDQFHPKGKDDKTIKPQPVVCPVRWWLASDDELPGFVMSQVAAIIQADRGRIDSYNTYAKLYGTFTPTFWNGYQLANSGRPAAPVRDRLTYNISQSCVDTLQSIVTINRPKAMFLTSGGDSKLQRRAKKLDAFCSGIAYENKLYKVAATAFRDSAVFGEGIVHCFAQDGRIKFERVLPYEILVDYLESHYGPESTYTIHRIKNFDRTLLAEMYPEKAEEIARMTNTGTFITAAQRSVSDTVTVVESWRLPVGSEDGMHSIVTANAVLERDKYEENFFPFAVQRYCPRLYGWYSQGMVEQLVPVQVEINRTLISIQRSLYMGGTHKIFVKNGSKVIKSHFDNLVGTILEYAGDTAPQYVVPQLVQPEIYEHLENMKSSGYQLTGISQMAAGSMKSPGVDSGRAMRTEQNIYSQRFTPITQGYADFFVDMSRLTVSVARKIYAEKKKLSVKVPGSRFIKTIDWKDVNLDDDDFILQVYPVSKLPTDPEGRLATIQEMMQAGLIDPQAGRRLLDFPDLEAEESLGNASSDYLHKILDKIVEDEDFTPPEPFDDLTKAQQLAMEYYAQGKLNNLEDSKLELLRKFMKQVQILQTPPAPPMQGLQPGGPPQAVPMPPPQSNMIPNVQVGAGQ
jgi:hypothetical protein